MTPLDSNTACLTAIQTFAMQHGAKLAAADVAHLIAATSQISPVPAICDSAEILYVAQANITDTDAKAAARTLCAQLADYAAWNGWHGMGSGTPSRGVAIRFAMQRELGETPPSGTAWPAAESDPAADQRFLPPPPPPAPDAPEEAPAAPAAHE